MYIVHHMCARCLWGLEEEIRSPGTEDTDDSEGPCVFWNSNSGLQQEHKYSTTELTLQPQIFALIETQLFNLSHKDFYYFPTAAPEHIILKSMSILGLYCVTLSANFDLCTFFMYLYLGSCKFSSENRYK